VSPVVVAGMHRSGTSMVSKLLAKAGLELGPADELVGPAPDNEDGFWENARFVELDEELLGQLGGGWDSPPREPVKWDDPGLERLRASAKLLVSEFDACEAWGWKDPRTSLTLPFWQPLVRDLRVVVCVRNPLEVALSLHRRNSLSYSLSLGLWQDYNLRLLAAAPERRRVVTHYDAYFANPQREVERLLAAVGLDAGEAARKRALRAPIRTLRHGRFTVRDLIDADAAPELVDLYLSLCREAEWLDGRPMGAAKAGRQRSKSEPVRRVNDAVVELKVLRRAFARQAEELEELRGLADEAGVERERLAHDVRERDETIVGLREELDELAASARSVADELALRDEAILELRRNVDELGVQAQLATGELEKRDTTIVSLEERFAALEAASGRAARADELHGMAERLRGAEEELAATRAEVAVLREQPRGPDLASVAAALRRGLDAAVGVLGGEPGTTALDPAPGETNGPVELPESYRALCAAIQRAAHEAVPAGAQIAVVSRGDDALLRLLGRGAQHFPRAKDGCYAGYHPADSGAAINHLERVREAGAEFLLFPATAFWWLDHYDELRHRLEERYRLAVDDAACRIYDLRAPRPPRPVPAPGGNGVDVLCFPIIEWSFRFQRPQQLLTRFARSGHRVFYVSTRFQQERDEVLVEPIAHNVYALRLPGPEHVNLYRDSLSETETEALLAALDRARRRLRIAAAISIVDLPFWTPVALGARERFGWRVVYDCMDEHSGFSTTKETMLESEETLVEESDLVLATSHLLYEKSVRRARRTLLLPNAVDFAHFSQRPELEPEELAELPRPIVGYYGAISDWFDTELVATAARTRPDWSFVLIGHTFGCDLDRLQPLPNVHLLGERPYASLPAYLHRFDVACIPFLLSPLTQATNPVKFYEYLSAGKPVVSVDLPELAPYREHYYSVRDGEEFVVEVERALADDSEDAAAARVELARRNTWEVRHASLTEAVATYYPKAAIVILSFDNLEYLRLCLESIWRQTLYPNFEVIVVDNASSKPVVEFLARAAERETRLRVILNEENVGFARANNQGLAAAADAEYLFLLNDDTVVTRGWLGKLIRYLQDETIGLVGPVSNWAGNEARIDVPYEDVADLPAFAEAHMREHAGESFDIPVLAMYCVGIRRSVLERVGYLNERFEIGMFEDDDFANRVRNAWYRVVCAEDVYIHHWGRASFGRLDQALYDEIFERNRRTYEELWGEWQPHRSR